MKIAFAGTGYINKVHAQAAKNAGLELTAVVNHKKDSMIEFGKQFNIARQYEKLDDLLKDGGADALVVSIPGGLEGLINMKVVDAAYEFSRTGKVIEVQ
ncbi:MAG: Gfo/Idh/MocA family oxidoreductase [Anaerolineales bacterium]|nr:Gfo/Idh/MocA family oxidoreductase [Anaerolineales bacterium]